jgi:hypothetical protein
LKFLETFSKKFLSGVQGQSPASRLPDKLQFISHYAVIGKFTDYNTRRDAADWRQYA